MSGPGGYPSPTSPRSPNNNQVKIHTVNATHNLTNRRVQLKFNHVDVLGQGSFGLVMKIRIWEPVAIYSALKRTKQDKRFKNRELQIMQHISHKNIIKLHYHFLEGVSEDDLYLNLVLEHVPETIYRTYRNFVKRQTSMPLFLVKLYTYQLFRALAFLHSMGIAHRDLKPHNIMTDPESGRMVLIDFGSAKVLRQGEPNVSYTCSRYYRAPELIFGSTQYTNSIDIWSSGCILAELIQGSVYFPGSSGIDQLVEIIKILGTPSVEQIRTMNPSYATHAFPQIQPARILPNAPPNARDLLYNILRFDPYTRVTASAAMAHSFFDDLRHPDLRFNGGRPIPDLFDFSPHELSIAPALNTRIIPPHYYGKMKENGIDLESFRPIDLSQRVLHLE